jgi:predicted permease
MSKLVSMMIIAAVGLLTIRIGLLDERDRRQLAKLSLYVLQPCLIVMSFQIELTPERLKGFGLAVVFAALVHLGFIIAAEILERIGLIDAVEELTIIYTNCGNLILPIVSMTL